MFCVLPLQMQVALILLLLSRKTLAMAEHYLGPGSARHSCSGFMMLQVGASLPHEDVRVHVEVAMTVHVLDAVSVMPVRLEGWA